MSKGINSTTMLGKYAAMELDPMVSDCRPRSPDYIGVGTPKSGTSWWYQCLVEHPNISNNRLNTKEITYFQHLGLDEITDERIETYKNFFSIDDDHIVGEWSPGYMFYPLCMENISKAAPNTKLIIMLRNPVNRVLSQINMMRIKRGKYFNMDRDREYIFNTFSLIPEAFNSGYYSYFIRKIMNLFEINRILILVYENCVNEPQDNIKKTYQFLGVDDSYYPDSISRKINVSDTWKNLRVNNVNEKFIKSCFRNEVEELTMLLPDLDLSAWGYS